MTRERTPLNIAPLGALYDIAPGVYFETVVALVVERDGDRVIIERRDLGTGMQLADLVDMFVGMDGVHVPDHALHLQRQDEPAGELPSNHAAPGEQDGDDSFVCKDCGKEYKNARALWTHRGRKHAAPPSAPDAPPVVILEDGTEDLDIVALDDEPNPTLPQRSVGQLGANGHAGTVAAT